MNLKSWMRGKPEVRNAAPYTDGLVELLLAQAGATGAEPTAKNLAVVEVAAGLVGTGIFKRYAYRRNSSS